MTYYEEQILKITTSASTTVDNSQSSTNMWKILYQQQPQYYGPSNINYYPYPTNNNQYYPYPDFELGESLKIGVANSKLTKEEFEAVKIISNPSKENIFKPGYLYKFNHNFINRYNTSSNIKDNIAIILTRETQITQESLLLNYGQEYQDDIFLCLDSFLENRDDMVAVSRGGQVKVINRSWCTRFLFNEKVYQFKWFENPQICNNSLGHSIHYQNSVVYSVVSFPGHDYFVEVK